MMEGVKSKDLFCVYKKFKVYVRVRILFLLVDYYFFISLNRKQSNCKFCKYISIYLEFQKNYFKVFYFLSIDIQVFQQLIG